MGIVLRCTEGPCAGETITIDSELLLGRERTGARTATAEIRACPDVTARLFVDERRPRGRRGPRLDERNLGQRSSAWPSPSIVETGDVLRVGTDARSRSRIAGAGIGDPDGHA